MKTEDIDKRISMPDVEAEWARFEKEVIDKKTNSTKKIWLGGISIAASIILVTGLFLLGLDNKETKQILSEHLVKQEVPIAPEGTEEPVITANHVEEQPTEPKKELAVLPASSNPDYSTAGHLRGITDYDVDSFLVVVNDKILFDSRGMTLEETEKRIEEYLNEKGLLVGIKIPYKNGSIVIMANTSEEREEMERMIATADIVPNFQPTTLRLRGITPHEKVKQPLIVINDQIFEIPDSVDFEKLDTEEQFANLLGIKLKDLKSIVVLKDDESTAKWGEKGKYGVIKITTKPSLALKDGDKPLEGQIAGLDPSRFHGKVVSSNFRRPGFDEECDCYDSTLILLNGKEDVDFIKHYKKYFGTLREEDEMNKYIFQRNLVLFKILRYNDNEVSDYAHLFKGRPIKRIWDYQAKPFTPVSQLSAKELEERRVNYLRNTYLKGDSGKHYVRHFAPELFSSTLKERLFGILTTAERSTLHQYFGAVKQDSHGIYVPFIREATISASNDISFFDEGTYIIKDDPFIKKLIRDFKKTAKRADSSAEKKDSLFRIGFIYGGRVKDVPLHWFHYFSHGFGNLQKMLQGSSFDFVPDTDAPSYWWGEVYYSTKMPSQREGILIFLHAVDKLYATDCPEILTNRRCITGIVEDENGAPMAGVEISPYGGNYEGVKTDSTGRFELWLPYQDVKAFASKVGYKIRGIEPTDSAVTIRMKELNLNLIITPPPFEEK